MLNQLIPKICQQENIKVQALSRGWLFRLEKPDTGQVRYIFNKTFALNSQSSVAIVNDKFATFEVLHNAGVPIIDHAILYAFDNRLPFAEGCNTPEYLENYFNEHNQDIVLKPNHGLGGRGITHITSTAQFSDAVVNAFLNSSSASLCPFYHIHREYRVVMLDDEPRLIYGKVRGTDWRFNLQHGAKVVDVDSESELYNQLATLARRAINALNLRFCSVDIIKLVPHDPQTTESSFLIMEVNGTVAASHYVEQRPSQAALVENIYRDAILKMFE